jgi:hypothetical protein
VKAAAATTELNFAEGRLASMGIVANGLASVETGLDCGVYSAAQSTSVDCGLNGQFDF